MYQEYSKALLDQICSFLQLLEVLSRILKPHIQISVFWGSVCLFFQTPATVSSPLLPPQGCVRSVCGHCLHLGQVTNTTETL